MRYLILAVLLLATSGQAQTIYKCKDEQGRTVFTDVACADKKSGEVSGMGNTAGADTRRDPGADQQPRSTSAGAAGCNRSMKGHVGFIDRASGADSNGAARCEE